MGVDHLEQGQVLVYFGTSDLLMVCHEFGFFDFHKVVAVGAVGGHPESSLKNLAVS